VKLDVEGAEAGVIYSLGEVWGKVGQVVFEWHPRGERLLELLAFLRKKGFKITLKNCRNQEIKSYNNRDLILVVGQR
jgi:hypothetical protein